MPEVVRRIIVEQFNTTAQTIVKNSVDVIPAEGLPDETVLSEFSTKFVPLFAALHTNATRTETLNMFELDYDPLKSKWVMGNLKASMAPQQPGTRSVPSGEKLPYGLGHYIKTNDGRSRYSGKLILKPDTYEGETYAIGTYWRLTNGSLYTAVLALANAMKDQSPTGYDIVNVHSKDGVAGTVIGSVYRWTQKYRYPRPVLL